MPYIGTSPSNGVRRIYSYTATASQTIFSGASTEGQTLAYTDSTYIDVYQNGVLLDKSDYTSTNGTQVVLAQGASVNDVVVIIVYDVFSVADTVSKSDGGTFDGAVTMGGSLTATNLHATNIKDSTGTNTAMTVHSTGGISTLKRPQVHLSSTKSPNTYTISDQDFSAGGSLQLLPNSTAIDFTFDANGRMTPTHAGVYWIYGKIYLYTNANSGSGTLYAMKGNTGSAPYGGTGTQIGNLESFEWDGASGRIDKTLTGHHVEYIAAGQNVHLGCTSTDYYLGPEYHACGMIKLD